MRSSEQESLYRKDAAYAKQPLGNSTGGITYFPVMAQETAFTVDDLVQQGILEGNSNGDFRLESPVTRAEIAKMLGNALKLEKIAPVSFSDAPAGYCVRIHYERSISWFYQWV